MFAFALPVEAFLLNVFDEFGMLLALLDKNANATLETVVFAVALG